MEAKKGTSLADIHIPDVPENSPWERRSPFQEDTSSFPSDTENHSSFNSHSEPRKSGDSEFTPNHCQKMGLICLLVPDICILPDS